MENSINQNYLRNGNNTTQNPNQNIVVQRHQEIQKKQIYEDIQKNIKDTENYILLINKLKKSYNELIHHYFNSDKESRILLF